ncbi:MAG: CoA transferase, partial [Lachnospiraceae bacterium]|nr:CoA transferase [Lachnospiraceae bacterium]
ALVKETFRAVFRTKTRDEWTSVFSTLDACVEPVMDLKEVSKDEHLVSRGMWPQVEIPLTETVPAGGNGADSSGAGNSGAGGDTDRIKITQMGCPMNLSKCPPRYSHAGYPEGYHTEEILGALGYSEEEIREMT